MSPTDPPTGPPPEEPTPPLDAQTIAREIDRLTRRVQAMGEEKAWADEVREMWAMLRQLADGLTSLTAGTAPAVGRAWLLQVGSTEPAQAEEMLVDLVTWLDAVYLRYPGSELPACWKLHPWVVEELLWLRASHAEAYAARTWGVPVGMWHDQQRPRVVERIRPLLSSCDIHKHEPAGQEANPPIAAPLGGHAAAVAAEWVATGLPLEPTPEMIADARAYDDLLDQRTH